MTSDTSDAAQTIEFEHGGTQWSIPADLVALQQRWNDADAECSQLAAEGNQAAYNEASGKRLDITLALYRSPWLREAQDAGRRFQADMALKALARAERRAALETAATGGNAG